MDRNRRRVLFHGDLARRRVEGGTRVTGWDIGAMRVGAWHDHTFTEHQAGKIRNKLLREWSWSEGPTSEIDPAFRALYKEHVADRYGDADDPRIPPTSAQPADAPLQRLGCGALVPFRDLR